jgi:hypothetical protein
MSVVCHQEMPISGEHTVLPSVSITNYLSRKEEDALCVELRLRRTRSMLTTNISLDTKNSYRQRNENASGESYVSGVTNFELVDLL